MQAVKQKPSKSAVSIRLAKTRPAPLPKSLYEAAGLMRHKAKALEAHLRKVRNEWR